MGDGKLSTFCWNGKIDEDSWREKESRVGRKRWGEVILFLLLATDLMGGTFLYVAISRVDFPSFLYEHANKK